MDCLNLVKLCVGTKSTCDLQAYQNRFMQANNTEYPRHVTRFFPQKSKDILATGGSLYWVFNGLICGRQRIVDFQPVLEQDSITRCAIMLDKRIVLTHPRPMRAFQGWRYLTHNAAPPDVQSPLAETETKADIPFALWHHLDRLGVRL